MGCNETLQELYGRWLDDIKGHKENGGIDFLSDSFSNPHYASVGDDWNEKPIKVLFVGQELKGDWGKPDINPYNILELQNKNRTFFPYWKNGGGKNFGRTVASIMEHYKDGAFTWSNCDKVCRRKRRAALLPKQRKELHSIKTKVLREEIEIIKPTNIIFLGVYWESLIQLFGENNQELLANWKNKNVFSINIPNHSEIKCCISYNHPQWKWSGRIPELVNKILYNLE